MQKSWVDKMLECIRNRDKQAKKKSRSSTILQSPTKRQRLASPKDDLLRRYPARVFNASLDDPVSLARHNKAITEESKKTKPRDSVLLPLMKSTFQQRRMFIQTEALSVTEILEKFPALNRSSIVSQS